MIRERVGGLALLEGVRLRFPLMGPENPAYLQLGDVEPPLRPVGACALVIGEQLRAKNGNSAACAFARHIKHAVMIRAVHPVVPRLGLDAFAHGLCHPILSQCEPAFSGCTRARVRPRIRCPDNVIELVERPGHRRMVIAGNDPHHIRKGTVLGKLHGQ